MTALYRKCLHFIIFFAFVCVFFSSELNAADPNKKKQSPDVVLLIDVSGSMKQNDPNNLRQPAAKLLIHLLKNKANMGVITFDEGVKLIKPTLKVDDNYENNFAIIQKAIHSKGQRTDILSAIKKGNIQWKNKASRYLILLTDGKIDKGSKPLDAKDRAFLLNEMISELNRDNVHVYTIGLSNNIDVPLLKTLSDKTKGVFQKALNASELQKTLYRFYTGVINEQGIPIQPVDKTVREVKVDKSIKKLTFTFDKSGDGGMIEIVNPDNMAIKAEKGKVAMLEINHYSFVEIKSPKPGNWKIKGAPQTIERVVVLTTIALESTRLKGAYFSEEDVNFSAKLLENNVVIKLPVVLFKTHMNVLLQNEKSKLNKVLSFDDEGVFKKMTPLHMKPGLTLGSIAAVNKDFMRENQFLFQIKPTPFKLAISEGNQLTIELKSDLVDEKTVAIALTQKQKADTPLTMTGMKATEDLNKLCDPSQSSELNVIAAITAKTKQNREVHFHLALPTVHCVSHQKVITPLISMVPKIALPVKRVEKKLKETPKVIKKSNDIKPKPEVIHAPKAKSKEINIFLTIGIIALLSIGWLIISMVLQHLYRQKIQKIRGQ